MSSRRAKINKLINIIDNTVYELTKGTYDFAFSNNEINAAWIEIRYELYNQRIRYRKEIRRLSKGGDKK